jgi:xanthine dehydrogenase accessory factor
MAIITADGGYHGWLGGNCTQPTVRREARRALAEGTPRLISLSPDPKAETRPGVSALPMTCHSGGTVDIYLEPVLPPPRLLLFGASPAVRALALLGKAMGYAVDVVASAADRPVLPPVDRVFADASAPELRVRPASPVYAVVATMGENDEDSAAAAIEAQPAYLGIVASRTRFAELRETLVGRGVAADALDRIHNPAGLDIGARLPEEVALSILAEIVKERHAAPRTLPVAAAPAVAEAVDPICGMTVAVAGARHRAQYEGREYFFCCAGCREKFLASPGSHASAGVVGQ